MKGNGKSSNRSFIQTIYMVKNVSEKNLTYLCTCVHTLKTIVIPLITTVKLQYNGGWRTLLLRLLISHEMFQTLARGKHIKMLSTHNTNIHNLNCSYMLA